MVSTHQAHSRRPLRSPQCICLPNRSASVLKRTNQDLGADGAERHRMCHASPHTTARKPRIAFAGPCSPPGLYIYCRLTGHIHFLLAHSPADVPGLTAPQGPQALISRQVYFRVCALMKAHICSSNRSRFSSLLPCFQSRPCPAWRPA